MKITHENLFFITYYSHTLQEIKVEVVFAFDLDDSIKTIDDYYNYLKPEIIKVTASQAYISMIEHIENNFKENKDDCYLSQVIYSDDDLKTIKSIDEYIICNNIEEITPQLEEKYKYFNILNIQFYNYHLIFSFLQLINDYLSGKKTEAIMSLKLISLIEV